VTTEDTVPDFIDSLPTWLADAVHARRSDANRATESRAVQARHHAALVNQKLDKLGITPRRRAAGSDGGWLTPALLVEPGWDDGEETWGVEAAWDTEAGHVALLASMPGTRGKAGELTGIDDVVRAMYGGPAAKAETPRLDVRAKALASVDSDSWSRASQDSSQIAAAIQGLTAAVLYLAEETARQT